MNDACGECGWRPEPAHVEHEVVIPRAMSGAEQKAIVWAAVVGGAAGLLQGWYYFGPIGALFVGLLFLGFSLSATVLFVHAVAFYREVHGRFRLRTLLILTAVVALLSALVRLMTPANTDWLIDWHMRIDHRGLGRAIDMAIGLAAVAWLMTVPGCSLYYAYRPVRFRPAPMSKYGFLGSFTYLQTLVLLAITTKQLWTIASFPLAVAMMCIAAVVFLIEVLVRSMERGLVWEALVAVALSGQTYLALLWVADAMRAVSV